MKEEISHGRPESENFEQIKYREELAKKIKEAPKENRKDILEETKETPKYWQARTEKIKERQEEQEVDDGLGVLVNKKTLYHGSGTSGIEKFDKAEEDTVGSGIYFTSEAKDAIGYARLRSERERRGGVGKEANKDAKPIIYESSIENMKLCDLRKDENLKKVFEGFKQVLKEELKKYENDPRWYMVESLRNTIEMIDSGKASHIKDVAFNQGELFSAYIKSLGYEGLITFEGGEGGNESHDTYLIFKGDKVKINQEHNISIE